MTVKDAQDYYSGLLIAQYYGKPKAAATIKLLAAQMFCDGLVQKLMTAFDLETAQGEQLDFIARIVGVKRNIYGYDLSKTYSKFTSYADDPTHTGPGWGSYSDSPYPEGSWRRYMEGTFYTLTDFELGNLVKLKIIYNNTPSTTKAITDALYSAFSGGIDIIDNLDMTVKFTCTALYVNVVRGAEFLDILPRPMGVGYTVTYPA